MLDRLKEKMGLEERKPIEQKQLELLRQNGPKIRSSAKEVVEQAEENFFEKTKGEKSTSEMVREAVREGTDPFEYVRADIWPYLKRIDLKFSSKFLLNNVLPIKEFELTEKAEERLEEFGERNPRLSWHYSDDWGGPYFWFKSTYDLDEEDYSGPLKKDVEEIMGYTEKLLVRKPF